MTSRNFTASADGPDADILARKLGISVSLTKKDRGALTELQSRPRRIAAGEDLLVDGTPADRAYVVRSGWAVRYKLLPDGRRQVLSFVLPGDIVGFREYLFQVTSHSVGALEDLVVSTVNPNRLINLFRSRPRLAFAIAMSAAREGTMLEEQVVRIGRRNAYERMAHLFLELRQRLDMVGQARESGFEMPVSQVVLADALGLSVVHVNRTLKRFQREGLIEVSDGTLILQDRGALEEIADFEGRYLYQKKPVRTPHALVSGGGPRPTSPSGSRRRRPASPD